MTEGGRALTTTELKDVYLLKHIDVSAAGNACRVRMGDLSGDGRLDFVLLQPDFVADERYFPHEVACATAYSADGEMLWQIGKPCYDASECLIDIPAQIYDIDRDGYNEFICVTDGMLCIFDGRTGELKRKAGLPDEYAHDCIAIADLEGTGYPCNIIIKNRYHQLWALDRNLNVLWTYKGNIGHYPVVCDLNGDGREEIISGTVVLSSDGEVLWSFDRLDYPKCICVGDLNLGGEKVIIAGGEKTSVYGADGSVKWELKTKAETAQIVIGNIRPDCFGCEIAGFFTEYDSEEYTDGIFLTDYHGNTLFKEKRKNAIKKSEITAIYNFDGKGNEHILVSSRPGVSVGIYDGHMNPLYEIPTEGLALWGDILGDGISQLIVYTGQYLDIYSAEDYPLSIPNEASPRPQPRRLYNYSRYPYRAVDMARNALGYAIGQFTNPDIRAWAERTAAEENEDTVTRADFCVVLVNTLGISGYSAETFFDISKNDYFYPAVATLKSYGYIDNIVGKFGALTPVTAEFALELIQKTSGFVPLTKKSSDEEITKQDFAKMILQIFQNKEETDI